ncbi:hypothetical protein ACJ6WF_17035 [Streptomyces sp. MMS24-I2-30]|uniref:hypothetical protein n=1 Tax=Streptomyces sp. MMS24-I2-30 TaxID=3351564 RepID=UPI003896A69D
MPGRSWEPTKRGAKDLNRWLSKGKTVYTIRETAIKLSSVPRPPHVYAAHTFDRQSRFTGEWMTSHLSASGLLAQEGTVYEQPPAGVPEIGDPGPDCPPPDAGEVHGWINTNY